MLIATAISIFALLVVAFAFIEGGAAELRVSPPTEPDDDSGEGTSSQPSLIMQILNSDASVL